ncbi:hypothetical protein [Actinomadura sp. 3N407]|uniref:hypothetical protein n=1 Tax=Actinomadura sp. 3N407 TaxID=3457423 RepID=UPI003FCDD174
MAGRGNTLQGTAPGRARAGEMQAAMAEAGLSGLSYGQLAVALAASDMPDQRQDDVPAEWLAKWARQGVDRLSVRGVRELDECSIRVNLAFLDGHLTRAGHAALVRQMWGSNRRRQLSHDLACRAGHWPGGGR